jgi:hypothetical protein
MRIKNLTNKLYRQQKMLAATSIRGAAFRAEFGHYNCQNHQGRIL